MAFRHRAKTKSLVDFFEMEWNDWAESVPFLRDQGREAKGVTPTGKEVSISKVSANYTYQNVFGLRRHKFGIMKQILEAVPRNVKFVHLKELERSPEMFIQGLVREFDLTVRDGYEPQPPSKVAHTTGKKLPWFAFRSCRHFARISSVMTGTSILTHACPIPLPHRPRWNKYASPPRNGTLRRTASTGRSSPSSASDRSSAGCATATRGAKVCIIA